MDDLRRGDIHTHRITGPSVLLCLSKSVTQGFRSSVFTALGSLTAIMGILTLSFTG